MKSNKKIDRAVESIAKENIAVNRSIDGILEYVSNQNDADLRPDWHEIQRTSELILIQELVFGQDGGEESPEMPLPNRKSDGRKSEREGQSG